MFERLQPRATTQSHNPELQAPYPLGEVFCDAGYCYDAQAKQEEHNTRKRTMRKHKFRAANSAGYNLLEVMTVVAIIGILSMVAVPKLKPLMDRTQAKTSLAQITSAFQLARFSAVSAQQLVTVCPLDANNACSTDWTAPLTVFLDPNNTRALPDPTAILREFPALPYGQMKAAPANKNYFQYTAQGHSHGTIGHVRYCPEGEKAMARVVVNMAGRARAEWLPANTLLEC